MCFSVFILGVHPCSAQLNMFYKERCYRNKIIILLCAQPRETRLVSESGGLFQPEVVACKIMQDAVVSHCVLFLLFIDFFLFSVSLCDWLIFKKFVLCFFV